MKRQWSEAELDTHWTLTTEEEALLVGRVGHGRFGFLVLLKFFQYEGRFPKSRREVPADVMRHLATGLEMPINTLDDFKWDGRTAKRQRTQILEWLGIRRMEKSDWENLSNWLDSESLPSGPSMEQLTERTMEWLRTQRIDPPGPTNLEKLLRRQTHAFEFHLLTDIEIQLTEESRRALDNLLETSDAVESIRDIGPEPIAKFSHLRGDAGRVSLDTLLQELGKLKLIRELALPFAAMAALPKKWLQKFRQRACIETIWDLRRHPGITRHGLMAAFCHERQHEIIDGLIDLLMQITHKALSKAEKKVEQQLLADFQRVRGKTTVLFRLAEAAVNHPNDAIKDALYPVVGLQTLQDLVKEFKATGPQFHKVVHQVLRASYSSHYRRMLPLLLDALEFRSNNAAHQPVIDALALLKTHRDRKQQYFLLDEVPIEGVVQGKWREIVIEEDGDAKRINRINYEICVLQTLRDRLQCKEIWVEGAERYRNPDNDLPTEFAAKREAYYEALSLPLNGEAFITTIQQNMRDGLASFNKSLPKNPYVKLRQVGKNRICLTPLDAQPDPLNLQRVKAEVFKRWGSTSLLDVFKEADLRTHFSDVFQTAGTREVVDRSVLQRRLLLCLYGLGTNTGLKRVLTGEEDTTYKELRYVRERFIRKDDVNGL